MKTETLQVALFDIGYGCRQVAGKHMDGYKDWVRISEYKEIDFDLIEETEVISNHIQSIEKQIKSIMDESVKQIDQLKQKKAELMALKHEG